MKEEAAALGTFDHAGNHIQQRIGLDLLLERDDFRTHFAERPVNPHDGDAEHQGDAFLSEDQLFAIAVKGGVARLVQEAVFDRQGGSVVRHFS